jgi:hypothetical protein
VAAPSPAGFSSYGETATRDEVVQMTTIPAAGVYGIASVTPYLDEIGVHVDLGPNPDGAESLDDDVDSLDVVPTETTGSSDNEVSGASVACPYWYFSADHEATGIYAGAPLDPGDIYLVTAGGPVRVIDNQVHLGLAAGTDIDAFEFAFKNTTGGASALALLFSVSDDDPLTAGDESGGLNPAMVYFSFLRGGHAELFDANAPELTDDIDALASWSEALEPTPVQAPPEITSVVSRRSHGQAGVFDVAASLGTKATAIEPRQNGAAPQMIFNFSGDIEAADGSADCGKEVVVTNGSCSGVYISGSVLTVNMSFARNECVVVKLEGLRGANQGPALAGLASASIRSHEGNVNRDGAVNLMDLNAAKAMLFQPAGAASFQADVVCNGVLNLMDLNGVKANLFTAAPVCP